MPHLNSTGEAIILLKVEHLISLKIAGKVSWQVFSVEKCEAMYTLHGHYGPITAIFMDVSTSPLAGSASQDGTLCLWDLSLGEISL